MQKSNPYRKGTVIWAVLEGDWEDLTTQQIAEVLGAKRHTVQVSMARIKRELGYKVPCADGRSVRYADDG